MDKKGKCGRRASRTVERVRLRCWNCGGVDIVTDGGSVLLRDGSRVLYRTCRACGARTIVVER